MTTTATAAAKFYRLSALHFAKAAEGGERSTYYLKLAQGEFRRAQNLEAAEKVAA